jgi:hypothetical protein
MREKAWSTLVVTVHRCPENSQDGMHFVHNWLRKRPYALGKSLLTVQNRAQVHRKPTGDLVPFSPSRVLPRFVNPRIRSKAPRFSI